MIGGSNLDFYDIQTIEATSRNATHQLTVQPELLYGIHKDIIFKGKEMYAFWYNGMWRTNISDLITAIDKSLKDKHQEVRNKYPDKSVGVKLMRNASSGIMDKFTVYAKQSPSSNIQFNTKLIFSDAVLKREDYATSQLSYTPKPGDTPAFDEMMAVLYEQESIDIILWFMGALLTGSIVNIQKFLYLYGGKGTGKGTVLKLFKMLFDGYYAAIDLHLLTSDDAFGTGQIKEVQLLIDEDTDISKIKKDTNLLKLTAHEPVNVNAKYKSTYDVTFHGLLITASNKRYQVRNIDAGITRRAIVAEPTSNTIPGREYDRLMAVIKFELPHIAQKAIDLFKRNGSKYYDDHVDIDMVEATDHVFGFIRDHVDILGDEVSLKRAGDLYKFHLEDIGFDTRNYKQRLKEELGRYYRTFTSKKRVGDVTINNVFSGLKRNLIFPDGEPKRIEPDELPELSSDGDSYFDSIAKDYPAQYASEHGTPKVEWDKCTTTLKDIDTTKLHFVRIPLNHIVIDFDKKNEEGAKDLESNLRSARKFPNTYMELSKSEGGVHLHYIYDGDVNNLASLYEDDVEIKVFTGKQSLRRKLTKFNELSISQITTGLPHKEKKDGVSMYQDVSIIAWNEKKMRTAVKGNLAKKYHDATKPSMDFIMNIFEQAGKEGIKYDLNDMRQDVLSFAMQSSNNRPYCLGLVNKIKFCNIEPDQGDMDEFIQDAVVIPDEQITFFDIEIFPNLLVIVYKRYGDPRKTKLINPKPEEVEVLLKQFLVGYNNRGYDNHIVFNAHMGAPVYELYLQSKKIIDSKDDRTAGKMSGAWELSYADIYEYTTKKQSLKKWELELGIHHDELDLPWDQPVPEHLWPRVVEYCCNDVDATEEVFKATYSDYQARLILAQLSGLKVNATNKQHAEKFMFGDDPRPQDKFNYTDLSEMFPGYKYSFGKSEYRGEDPGEGGYVYSEPGVYEDVALLDVESMHPTSCINMDYFGPYSQKYADLKQVRVYIKHKDYESAGKMFGGILKPFLGDDSQAKGLSFALKIIINIVYGLSSASFDNKFKHKLNHDNIIAKRGALFMIDLKHAVQEKGFTVAHIKTDSIKIPNATPEIIDFVFEFGEKYGYVFDHEHTYRRMALVNKAVYIAQVEDGSWEPTGATYAEPFVYKTLFSKEEIVEEDYQQARQVQDAHIEIDGKFVGKFANVYASRTGGEMLRVTDTKSGAVAKCKGVSWKLMEEYAGKEDIDMDYYNGMVRSALDDIAAVGEVWKIVDEMPQEFIEYVLPF